MNSRASAKSPLQFRSVDLHPRRKRARRVVFYLAFPDAIAAEGEQCVALFSAEAHARDATEVGNGKDDLSRSVISANLNSATSRHELSAFD